jgi:hypothetical protein
VEILGGSIGFTSEFGKVSNLWIRSMVGLNISLYDPAGNNPQCPRNQHRVNNWIPSIGREIN